MFRLNKFINELVNNNEEMQSTYQAKTMSFIMKYIKMCIKFDVNIPNTHFQCIKAFVKSMILDRKEEVEQIMPAISGSYFVNSVQVFFVVS